jgi:hypothetical protein
LSVGKRKLGPFQNWAYPSIFSKYSLFW